MATTANADFTDGAVAPARARLARAALLEALLLGLLADSALRTEHLGLGWPIWIGALAATAFALSRRGAGHFTKEQTGWLSLGVACAALFAWRDAEMLRVGNVFATIFALVLLGHSRWHASVVGARVRDVAGSMIRGAVLTIGSAIQWVPEAAVGGALRDAVSRQAPILKAIALTAPIVLVFGNLLGSADPVFDAIFSVPGLDLGDFFSHAVMAAVFAWGAAGFLRGALVSKLGAPVDFLDIPVPRLGVTEITSMLGATVALFALFVGVQVRWLFGGAAVVAATAGLSVAEYARRGFFELLAVAVLVMPLVLVTGALSAGDDVAERRHRRLAIPTIGLLGFILLSAVMRMQLYVSYYGLSTDRLYALVFMSWLAFVFATLVFTVLSGRPRRFIAVSILGGYATLVGLNVANPEVIVARSHTEVTRERPVDRRYLARLSGDAMPVVAPWLAAAPADESSCAVSRVLRGRWGGDAPTALIEYNAGERAGRRAVVKALETHSLWRQCASSTTSPSVSLSR